eukprot:s1797_g1.t1
MTILLLYHHFFLAAFDWTTCATSLQLMATSGYADEEIELIVGKQVQVVGYPAHVRYIGEAHFAPGEWIGVELEPAVGKNDGSVMEHRYFTCAPKHGLFVRRAMVKSAPPAAPADTAGDRASAPCVKFAEEPEDPCLGQVADDHLERVGSSDDEVTEVEEVMVPTKSVRRGGVSAEAMRDQGELWQPPVYEKSAKQKQQLRRVIESSHDSKLRMMFGNLSPKGLEKVVEAMFQKTVPKGETIIKYGDEGDNFYIVKSGKFDIFAYRTIQKADDFAEEGAKTMMKVFEAGEGFAFGETALLYNAPRSATITASQEAEVWCLERRAFRELVIRASEQKFKEYSEFLKQCDVFQELDVEQIATLAEVVDEEDFNSDEAIIQQGGRDSNMFIILKGQAMACISGEKGEVQVKTYNTGDFFGEIALLLGEPRKASIYAKGEADVVCHQPFMASAYPAGLRFGLASIRDRNQNSRSCTLHGWSGRYETEGFPVLKVEVTPELFTAEFFSDNLPDYMEEELHEIFSALNGQHSRQEAEETQRCSDCAQIDAWSATAQLCPEAVVDQVFDPWEKMPGWSAEGVNACSFNGWSGRYKKDGQPVLMDVVRDRFCKFREGAWDYFASDRACHLWTHHRLCHGSEDVPVPIPDPWQRLVTSPGAADRSNGCEDGHWMGIYTLNSATVLSVNLGPATSTIQVFPEATNLELLDAEDLELLQKVNGTKFNDELTEILCDIRRSNPWNIEVSDKACHLWSQTRCKQLCSELEVLGPLRDFLKRNLEKYSKYQDAIAQGAEIREVTDDGDDFRTSKEKEEQLEKDRQKEDEARPTRRRLLRKADRANTVYNVKIKMPVDLDLEEEEEEAAPQESQEVKESPPTSAGGGQGWEALGGCVFSAH